MGLRVEGWAQAEGACFFMSSCRSSKAGQWATVEGQHKAGRYLLALPTHEKLTISLPALSRKPRPPARPRISLSVASLP